MNAKNLLLLLLICFAAPLLSQDLENNSAPPTSDVFNGQRGILFNDGWKFIKGNPTGAETTSFDDSGWRNQPLPHDWGIEYPFNQNSPAGYDGGFLDGGIGWYRKTFSLAATFTGKHVTIQFEGVYMNSTVWLNGQKLGNRPYGYSTFEYDLTPYLKFGGAANILAVKVDNSQQSNSRWYSGSGIYRNVWITPTDPVHIAYCGNFVTTPVVSTSASSVLISTQVQNQSSASQAVSIKSTVYDMTGTVVATASAASVTIAANASNTFTSTANLTSTNLWSTTSPYLYSVKTQVMNGSAVLDSYTSTLGFKTVTLDPNTGFSLNGVNMKLHGVCLHHDLGCLGSAHNYRALERQVQLMKSYGINAIRTSHNPPAPQLLEICNRLGIMIMDEVFDCWSVGKVPYDYHMYFNTSAQQDVTNWILRDRNQPCVIMWSIGNEIPDYGSSSGVTAATNILKWLKALDNTHKTVCGSMTPMPTGVPNMLDVVGYNYATGGGYDADHAAHPNWVLMGSETASAYRSRGVYHYPIQNSTNADYQCNEYDNNYPGWGTTAENSWIIDRDRKYVMGQFIWTGFDYIGEPKPYQQWPARSSYFGIIDLAGFPKDIYYFYQSQWLTKPMVHILPQNWNWTAGTSIPVWTFSNCDSVRLILNGTSLGAKKKSTAAPLHEAWSVTFAAGTVKAYGFVKGVIVARDSVTTAGTAAKLLAKVDRDTIRANGLDVAFIEVDVQDAKGILCPTAVNLVKFTLTGPGKIVGTDNGNAISHESFLSPDRNTFGGKCLAVVQSTGAPGKIVVTASSGSFTSSSVTINSVGSTNVSVNELQSQAGMLLYPNPASSVLNIQWAEPTPSKETMELFDVIGKKLMTRAVENGQNFMQLDISGLKAGLYFLKCNGQTEKFVVNR